MKEVQARGLRTHADARPKVSPPQPAWHSRVEARSESLKIHSQGEKSLERRREKHRRNREKEAERAEGGVRIPPPPIPLSGISARPLRSDQARRVRMVLGPLPQTRTVLA